MTLAALTKAAAEHRLAVFGWCRPRPQDGLHGFRSIVLLGPEEPGFWAHVTAQPEFSDDRLHPLDRWSRRVIGRLACDFSGKARFPFGGPPWSPFTEWSLLTGRTFASPVHLLVNDRAGLFISFRGAIALRQDLEESPAPHPCPACAAPCRTACPVNALTAEGYDVRACRAWAGSDAGRDCREGGCLVRRACPLSLPYGRVAAQSAYHMSQFLKAPSLS